MSPVYLRPLLHGAAPGPWEVAVALAGTAVFLVIMFRLICLDRAGDDPPR